MRTNSACEICSSRELNAPVETVYQAFANPVLLKKWWGPKGFTNTIHEFDLRPDGKWLLTMHGPENGNYENASLFRIVEPNKRVAWTRLSQPLFDMEIEFEQLNDSKCLISFIMTFKTVEECEKMKKFVVPKNEENFDRLEKELFDMLGERTTN